jgi:signal transduction histidine kinase
VVPERVDPEEMIGQWLRRHDGRLGTYRAPEATRPAELLRELESAIALLSMSHEELRARRQRSRSAVGPIGDGDGRSDASFGDAPDGAAGRLAFERGARRAAENGERQARFLADAAQALLAASGVGDTLQRIVELAVPTLGTYATLDAAAADVVQRVAVHHVDESLCEALRRTIGNRTEVGGRYGVQNVLATKRACIVERTRDGRGDASLPDGLELLLPLVVEEDTVYVLTVSGGVDDSDALTTLECAEPFAGLAAAALRQAGSLDRVSAAARDAERANAEKRRFLSVLSHEIRTPLSSALGYVELLLAGIPNPLPAEHRPYVDGIHSSIRHQLGIVDQILQFASTETRQHSARQLEVDILRLLRDVADLVRPTANAAGLDLEVAADDGVIVCADEGMLRQALLNLANNAVRFTQQGRIRLAAVRDGDDVVIRIVDTGPGIPDGDLELIFHAFWRGSESAARAPGGMGLGLSITRELVTSLGGSIDVSSELGNGSEFRVVLRAASADGAAHGRDGSSA